MMDYIALLQKAIRLAPYVYLPFLLTSNAMANGYNECVGRYALALPGPVDVATTTPQILDGEFIRNPTQFADGQPAMYSSFGFNGSFIVVQNPPAGWVEGYLKKKRHFVKLNAEKIIEDQGFFPREVDASNSFAISGDGVSEFNVYKDGRFIGFKAVSYDGGRALVRQRARDTFMNLHVRQPYQVPVEEGACLPGIFVSQSRAVNVSNVGVTFRLKEHPDVTIFLADRSAGDLSKMTSQQRNEFVWTSDAIGRVIHLHGPLRYRPTMMAGRWGTASFATVTGYDGATDYAYLVTVQGDPNATVDTPDLELLVQRTARYAAKGVPPVSGDELERIAKAVAASVKRRPVQ
ncbi:T6SS immunity protein Tli4 family protein [Burkholderia sp. WSM2232]|uniref:T6SS immunity protein Tli4 family protein n=1 Tax=Burkholderia sp. WSM2232 TaxID=944436 RepID=UPI000481E9A9|nr:T6SS immunity protein Tli4 family protein [Burkholderia sp. WSM2232]